MLARNLQSKVFLPFNSVAGLVNAVAKFSSYTDTFKADDLVLQLTENPMPKPEDISKVAFGSQFTDHMFTVAWNRKTGWGTPMIKPLTTLNLHPATSVFHYAIELYEGMKAYRTPDHSINLFRPYENANRMNRTAYRASLPQFDVDEFVKCTAELIRLEKDWVPDSEEASLYVRPTLISTDATLGIKPPESALFFTILCPVGAYFAAGETFKAVSLLADPQYIRAARGGSGAFKMGSNYAPTIRIQQDAAERGYDQVLWLYGEDHKITEVGTMNLFMFWYNEQGEKELVTMGLEEGLVLPGITRSSLLGLARSWGEFKVTERTVTMKELVRAVRENRMLEMFGAGTACVVSPVDRIHYQGEDLHIPTMDEGAPLASRFYKELTDIQYGRTPHEWCYPVIDNSFEAQERLKTRT